MVLKDFLGHMHAFWVKEEKDNVREKWESGDSRSSCKRSGHVRQPAVMFQFIVSRQ